ncbi:hypothetical protein BC629DRAFT_695779 [Irpex lacteus]|nr:hypothetical protein BC629DRAFT_695779 [Irpex lacteus]
MFEEAQVCMVCGRPVDSDGQVYCSDECSTLDASTSSGLTSPSLSATSSAYASPYLTSTTDSADVPALVPSALGRSHRHKHSISSSSNSSMGWLTTEDLNDTSIHIHDPSLTPADPLSESTKSPQYLHPPHARSGMQYARRPSTTNHRSTVPRLLRHQSGMTTSSPSSASSFGAGKSMPSPYYAANSSVDGDDASSLCLSEEGDRQSHASSSNNLEQAQARRKRNRASLPAYFSLLQGGTTAPLSTLSTSSPKSSGVPSSSSSSSRHWRAPSALAQLSKSLQLASPTTPRVSHATVSANASDFTHANSPTSVKTERDVLDGGFGSITRRSREQVQVQDETRGRGRARTRDPDVRSISARRGQRSPRATYEHRYQERERGRARMSAAQRARIDSVEKVAEWVSSSPVIAGAPVRVKYEFVEALTRGLKGCAVESDSDSEESSSSEEGVEEKEKENRSRVGREGGGVRGRRRPDELDVPASEAAPGFGAGRSGLKGRGSVRVCVGAVEGGGW